MLTRLADIEAAALNELEAIQDLKQIEAFEVRFLGKKGDLTLLLRETGKLPEAERPAFGARVNEAKKSLGARLEERKAGLGRQALERRIREETLDATLPGRPPLGPGREHLLPRTTDEICAIFAKLGFNVETGPEVEDGFHNFDALNFPPDHPSRDTQDSYFLGEQLLRTHTSTVQVRVMRRQRPPIRMVAPGRVFRRDATDATHSPQFHQVEGLAVDAFGKVRFSDLKGTLQTFAGLMFGARLEVRLRPSFFPFTEPSCEVDVQCFKCMGKGCGLCKQSGWIEIMGAGMVNPAVFQAVGYDPAQVSGYAFGMGVERIAMLKHGIDDIRLFYENDLRFLRQF
jgi:phenylalanyl-tRNA synthetase alpha chain